MGWELVLLKSHGKKKKGQRIGDRAFKRTNDTNHQIKGPSLTAPNGAWSPLIEASWHGEGFRGLGIIHVHCSLALLQYHSYHAIIIH